MGDRYIKREIGREKSDRKIGIGTERDSKRKITLLFNIYIILQYLNLFSSATYPTKPDVLKPAQFKSD